jgi:hypothetical protein
MATATATDTDITAALGIGILRVSEEGDRGERIASYRDQEQRIRAEAARAGIPQVEIVKEANVSGGAPLEQRAFGQAIARVEDEGDPAGAILFAYRDRHDRSIVEGTKAIERMDAAGGLLLVDGKVLSHRTAAQWREASFGSLMSEDYRRVIGERSVNGVVEQLELGVVPFKPGPGFIRNGDGTVRVDEDLAPAIREAWLMRAQGDTIRAAREHLAAHGLALSYRSMQTMFKAPLYVGEVHKEVPDEIGRKRERIFRVCEPMIDRAIYDAVRAMRVPSGRTAKSDRLLARLGWAHCATCGARMVAGGQTWRYESRKTGEVSGGRFAFYKCGRENGDCPARATISAEQLEHLVLEAAIAHYEGERGSATPAQEAADAAQAADAAAAQLSAAKRRMMLLPAGDDDAEAMAIVRGLEADLREARAKARHLATVAGGIDAPAGDILRSDKPALLRHKRGLIRLAFPAGITIRPGRRPIAERVVGL